MKTISTLILISLSSIAVAGTFTDYATITEVSPIYETISKPETICSTEIIRERVESQKHYGGAIIGGTAGAVLGHQMGKGRGKDVATALGGIIGAMTGDSIENEPVSSQYQDREVKNCRERQNYVKSLTGYRVEYKYHDQYNTVIMGERPASSRLPLIVNFEPK